MKVKIINPSVELLHITENSKKLIELAGRTCYKSEDKITENSASKFIKMLKVNGHHSVLEHAYATFRIVTDRGVTHELVRHRLASYSQESTRYVKYDEMQVINPGFEIGSDDYNNWLNACEECINTYRNLLKNNSPQIARAILPTCLKTEIIMTANFREWMHIIELRSTSAAHPQIRTITKAISNVLHEYVPELFEKFSEKELKDVKIYEYSS